MRRVFGALVAIFLSLNGPALLAAESADAPDYAALQKRVDALLSRLSATTQMRSKLQNATASLSVAKFEELKRLAEETQRLNERATAAAQQLESLTTNLLPATLSVADLQRMLDEAQKERDQIVQKITVASIPEKPSGPVGIPGTVLKDNLTPIGVLLVKNRVVPLKIPYFSRSQGPGINRQTGEHLMVARIHRVKDGTPVTDAIRPGNLIDQLIREAGASKATHFFLIRVCTDSIPAYHALAAAVTQRGYDYTWFTDNDKDWVMPANGGGGGDFGPVRVVPADQQ